MPDTQVSNESYGSRIKSSFQGMAAGILFIAAVPFLFWNENRAVQTQKSLEEGANTVISVAAETISKENNGLLVHVTGTATTAEVLEDAKFGLAIPGIKLSRHVEMYQWKENKKTVEKKKLGGKTEKVTEYSYDEGWSEEWIDSTKFNTVAGHRNPSEMPVKSETKRANQVLLGSFTLPVSLIEGIKAYRPLPVTPDMLARVAPELRDKLQVYDDKFYLGLEPMKPRIGECRISFNVIPPSPVTVVAQQLSNTFAPYLTKNGRSLEILHAGIQSPEMVFQGEMQANKMMTWILRVVGFLLMAIGLAAVLKPLGVLADVVPFLGNFIHAGIGWVAVILAGCCTMITIAVAWIFFRPLLGIPLIIVSVAGVAGLQVWGKKKGNAAKPGAVQGA